MGDTTFSFPPRAMDERAAAYYCGLSVSTFRRQVTVPARALSAGRLGWLREELDEWLDGRPRAKGQSALQEVPARDDAEIRALAERLAAPKRAARRRASTG